MVRCVDPSLKIEDPAEGGVALHPRAFPNELLVETHDRAGDGHQCVEAQPKGEACTQS